MLSSGGAPFSRNPFEPAVERCSDLGPRGRVDRAGRGRRRTSRSRARRAARPADPRRRAGSRGRRGGRGRREAALARPGGQRRAQRLHSAHQPVPRSLHLLHVREATRRPGREVVHARGSRRGLAPRRERRLHRGALLSGRQARAGVHQLPRMARRAGPSEHGRVSRRGVPRGGRAGHAPAHQRGAAHAAADGRAAAVERVDGPDAGDHERAALREGRRAPRRARQEARAAPAHAPRGRRAADPVHDRDADGDRRDDRRTRRHALRDPRTLGPLRTHPGSHHPTVPSQDRHQDVRAAVARGGRRGRLGRAGASGARARR